MSSDGYTFTQQAPAAPGPGLGPGVTGVDNTPVPRSSQNKHLRLQEQERSASGYLSRWLQGLRRARSLPGTGGEATQQTEKREAFQEIWVQSLALPLTN